VEEFIGVV